MFVVKKVFKDEMSGSYLEFHNFSDSWWPDSGLKGGVWPVLFPEFLAQGLA